MSIIVAGTVSGDLSASQRIELHASAKVSGNLTAPTLVVHEGAVSEGDCAMQPQGAGKPAGQGRTRAAQDDDQKLA
jgi:cytoskeletal protein CcmA (bactofilin family)